MVRVHEFDDFTEFKRRWNETLTYYPDVARAGNLAVAITRALAQAGSSLRAYCPYPPDMQVWSAHTDHREAPGQTVPQVARVRLGNRHCEVRIASSRNPLGSYGLSFYRHDIDTYPGPYEGSHTNLVGWVVASGLSSAVPILRRALEDGARIDELAR